MSDKYHHMYDNRRWRKARELFLRESPTCKLCEQAGRVSLATVVDHVLPHRGDLGLFWDQRNWMSVCQTCHSGAKQSAEATAKPVRGCDVNGMPLDPTHPWNKR